VRTEYHSRVPARPGILRAAVMTPCGSPCIARKAGGLPSMANPARRIRLARVLHARRIPGRAGSLAPYERRGVKLRYFLATRTF
jgi:hypothetical protein